jgi:very-short-patch-repair endonuclease
MIDVKNVKAEFLPCLNYAMAVNGQKCLEFIEISNPTADDWHGVQVKVSGDLIADASYVIDTVPAGMTVRVTDLDVKPDLDKLREMTESVETAFTLTVGDAQQSFPLRLLAFDEWPGVGVRPEMLAAFVTPNAPQLSQVKMNAAAILEKLTGSAALDEYQTQDPNRARAQVAAIYEALRGEGLVYAAPPASYEKTGQRVRLVDRVLDEKLGTCMDLSLLMASVLESCGLHPLLVLQKGHMFVGCWLVDQYAAYSVSDDWSFLSKATANGVSQMVLLEATALASSDAIAFETAVEMGEKHLVAEQDKFVLFCDVYRSRMEGVRPLPMKVNGVWQNAGLEHEQATTGLKEVQTAELQLQKGAQVTRQQIWERKLLDFSLRNNLLNLRTGRRVIPFVSFDIDVLEDHIFDREDYSMQAVPVKKLLKPDEFGIYDSRLYKDELQQLVSEDIKHNRLNAYLSADEMASTQKFLYRESRTALEENGANSLYMVFGLMRWYENEKSVRPRYAPLLLMPVELVRRSGNNYVVRRRDEEMTINTTLVEMLRQQYQIDLKGLQPLPEDESGVDVRAILATVRAQLACQPRWDVVEEAMLGLFSFNKFVMWNDIHSNAEKMRRSPIIESLFQKHWVGHDGVQSSNASSTRSKSPSGVQSDGVAVQESPSGVQGSKVQEGVDETDARHIDLHVAPHEFAIPVDVDSSQMEAVVESGEGRSFILYGPPGTGKSQTITNMIANALYHGRRVLFVAEKMAALEVVQKRLKKIGLDPFCLELHSNKVTKSHLLRQLQQTLDLTRIKDPEQYEQASKELFEQRQQLTGYIRLLHKKQASGLSLYDCICRYEGIEGEGIPPSAHFVNGLTDSKLQEAAEKIETLDTVFAITGPVARHQLQGLNIYDPSQQTQSQIAEWLSQLASQVETTDKLINLINGQAGFKQPHSLNGARWAEQLIAKHDALAGQYTEGIFAQDPQQLRAQWTAVCGKWFLPRFFAKRSFMKGLRAFRADMGEGDVESLFGQLDAFRQQLREGGLQALPMVPPAAIQACRDLLQGVEKMKAVCDFDDENLDTLARLIPQWQQALGSSRDWAQWCIRKRELQELHLEKVVDYMNHASTTGHAAAQAMLKGTYKYMAMQIVDSEPQLQMFNGLLFEDAIAKYRDMAKQFQELTKKMLYCKLAANVPSQALKPTAITELGILKRYIATNGRGATIRHIMDQIPTLLPKLCPVMLMSPISVAQFIDLDQPPFDIVCFDEASQMPTSEAVGAIARGKALICVGDPKQMPPTSFFATNAVDEEEADIDDMESILDDCITLSLPARYLTWHYRSKHESLIAFSNAQYYESKLYTFPSVDDRASKVQLIPVDGTYDYGKTRCNRAEAEAIVKEVVRRLSDDELAKRSIGIVSFSKVQQNLIEDLLTDELAKHADLERKAYDVEEPIFIKNLENVQGDERDVILFSVGYGPDKTGKVSMNFGPLNNSGGERRLNVAVSRARYEMMVFSTLKPEQIDLRRSSALGVAGLKAFLEFARNGRMAVSAGQVKAPTEHAEIIDAVAGEIRKMGYEVDTSVGRSAFKIDLAVLDPKNDQNYLLGIICDGTRYYETKTERDREICQPGVLQGLGWKLMRLWSVDWLMNKEAVMDRIRKALEKPEEPKPACAPKVAAVKGGIEHAAPLPFAVSKDEIVKETEVTMSPALEKAVKKYQSAVDKMPEGDIEEYARFLIRQQLAVPLDDMKRQFAKAMGYSRRTQQTDIALETAVAMLIDKGEFTEKDGNITTVSN